MSLAGFELAIPAMKQPQNYALDRAAICPYIDNHFLHVFITFIIVMAINDVLSSY